MDGRKLALSGWKRRDNPFHPLPRPYHRPPSNNPHIPCQPAFPSTHCHDHATDCHSLTVISSHSANQPSPPHTVTSISPTVTVPPSNNASIPYQPAFPPTATSIPPTVIVPPSYPHILRTSLPSTHCHVHITVCHSPTFNCNTFWYQVNISI